MVEVIATFPAICRSGVVGFGSDGSAALVPPEVSFMVDPVASPGDETVCGAGGSGPGRSAATPVMRHLVLGRRSVSMPARGHLAVTCCVGCPWVLPVQPRSA